MVAFTPELADAAPSDSSIPRSRRALLAGALGGLAAVVATALGRPAPASAAAGSAMIVGSEANDAGTANTQLQTNSSVVAFKLLQNGPGTALMGYATSATGQTRGLYGRSDSPNGFGAQARNSAASSGTGAAAQAIGVNNHGLDASTDSPDRYAVRGTTNANLGTAIYGRSADGVGIHGHATDYGDGVVGSSVNGAGVSGFTTGPNPAIIANASGTGAGLLASAANGYAGDFGGRVKISQYLDFAEMTAPQNPSTLNAGRLFIRDNGAEKSQLCVIFHSGVLQVIATEP